MTASHPSEQENKTCDNVQYPPTTGQHVPVSGGGYYPTMGYPPPTYPSPQGYNAYPYAQPPPAAYYNPQQMTKGYTNDTHMRKHHPCIRACLILIVVVVMLICATYIAVWIIYRPEIPGFALSSLSVSNFITTSPVFAASWVANLTVHNTNTKLNLYVERIQSLVLYGEDDILASSYLEPFYMPTKSSKAMVANMTSGNGPGQEPVASWVVDQMGREKDGENGVVRFNFRMMALTSFKDEEVSSRKMMLRIHCGVKVNFVGNTGNGNAVLSPRDGECLVVS